MLGISESNEGQKTHSEYVVAQAPPPSEPLPLCA
jgi:hypothetical protein